LPSCLAGQPFGDYHQREPSGGANLEPMPCLLLIVNRHHSQLLPSNSHHLIVEPRYSGHDRPTFQAKFGVAEEEPGGPGARSLMAPTNHAPTVISTSPPGAFPMGGVAETREAPSNEGASFIFGAGQKKSAFSSF